MEKKNTKLLFLSIILLFSLINLSFSAESLNFDEEVIIKECKKVKSKSIYKLDITVDLEDFVKVEIEGQEEGDELITHVVDFRKKVDGEDRVQLGYSLTKSTVMWLTKFQLSHGDNFITIECSKYNCDYKIIISTSDTIEMDIGSQLTLFVSENDQKFKFSFNRNVTEIDEDEYATIWALGSRDIETELSAGKDTSQIKHSQSNIYNLKTSETNSDIYFLEIKKTEIGDLITVGSNLIQEAKSTTPIKVNEPEKVGYINKKFNTGVCFDIDSNDYDFNEQDIVYLIAIFNEKVAEVYYKESGDEMEETIQTVNNGYISHRLGAKYLKGLSFCVRLPTVDSEQFDVKEISFSIQLTNTKYSPSKTILYSPQKLGDIYTRAIPGGEIVTFIGMPPFYEAKNITYNLLSQFGFPNMYFDICTNYPFCDYTSRQLVNATDPHNINGMSTYTVPIDPKRTAISPKQDVLIVRCTAGNRRQRKEESDEIPAPTTCEFNTMIFTNVDSVTLQEAQLFNHFILSGDKDKYTVKYTGENKVEKIFIEIMTFTGDVISEIEFKAEFNKYQDANKVFYSVKIDPNSTIKEVNFSLKAKTNSYYSVMYTLIRKGDESIPTSHIPSGVSYLVTIEPESKDKANTGKKIINFRNLRVFDEHPFMVNFYSLNCRLSISAERQQAKEPEQVLLERKDDYYTQDILTKDMFSYFSDEYTYIAYVDKIDFTKSTQKICMVYVSCQELQEIDSQINRQILLSENVPQQIVFQEEFNTVKYLYALTNHENDLAIYFNLFDQAKYSVRVTIERIEVRYENITTSKQMYLDHSTYEEFCKKGDVCPVVVEIVCEEEFLSKQPQLEVSIKKVVEKNTPSYIIKNKVRTDYLNGDIWQYYYTDIGENEEGVVIANFYRGSGIIYGKIVPKVKQIAEVDTDWRDMYTFPKEERDSLPYIPYLKTLNIFPGFTSECTNGCYLLLSVKSSVKGEFNNKSRQYGFNLLVDSHPFDEFYTQYPLVNFPCEEYIIGNIPVSNEKRIQIFYSVYFPHDAEKIVIDFQSIAANLYINTGINSERPTTTSADFIYKTSGRENLFEITKEQFLEAGKKRHILDESVTSLKGQSLIIGVWADKTDSVFATVYSIKIHLPLISKKNGINIYDVNSDQKILCKTTKLDDDKDKNKNICLYMVKFDQLDEIFNLLIYPVFKEQSTTFEMHADFILSEKYDLYDEEYLMKNIPTKDSEFSTTKTNLDFIYLNFFGRSDSYLYVSIVTKEPTITQLLSSFYTFDEELTPNPSTSQLFIVEDEVMKFNFVTYDDLEINIVSLNGEANIFWESDLDAVYHLKGRDERLSLTSSIIYSGDDEKDSKRMKSKLVVQNLHPLEEGEKKNFDNPKGFAFYITYYLRSPMINLDHLIMGKSSNFAYRESDLPIAIYSPLEKQDKDTSIFFTFYDLIEERYTNKVEPVKLYASVIKESTIFDIKMNPELKPSSERAVKGVYDPSIRTGVITLKPRDIAKFGIKDSEKPTLMIQVEKGDQRVTYSRVGFEAAVIQDSSLVGVTERVYQFGKLSLEDEVNIYKLRTDKKNKVMRINLSFNTNYLDWAVSVTPGSTKNDTFVNATSRYSNGRLFYSFEPDPEKVEYVYLMFFHSKAKSYTDKLTNYAFKYINSENDIDIRDYTVSNSNIECKRIGDFDYSVTITAVPNLDRLKASYFLQFVPRSTLIEGEHFQTIAVTESPQTVLEFNNPKINDEKITLEAKGIFQDIVYLQVIAYIHDGPNNEYVAYNSLYFEKSLQPLPTPASNGSTTVFIVISIILLIVVIVLIYFLFKFSKKNKDLLDKVNKTSFQQENEENINGDGLLFNEGKLT